MKLENDGTILITLKDGADVLVIKQESFRVYLSTDNALFLINSNEFSFARLREKYDASCANQAERFRRIKGNDIVQNINLRF